MGRYLLGGREARLPYEVEELNIRLYTVEELCYYIYHDLPLIGDEFIDERLLSFIRKELDLPEIADKIERFYVSPSDLDTTLIMLLSEVGFYSDQEIMEFKNRLALRRRKSRPERIMMKAESLFARQRYVKAIEYFRMIANDRSDQRITQDVRRSALEGMGDSFGRMFVFDRAIDCFSRAYEESKQERLLKKIYQVSVISGEPLPDKYFSLLPESLISEWQQEYWNKEIVIRNRVENSEVLKLFFLERSETEEALQRIVDERKERFRLMAE